MAHSQTFISFVQKITPHNLLSEKEKFFFDPSYNPQFTYEHDLDEEEYTKFGPPESTYLEAAENIMRKVLKKYDSYESYIQTYGPVLSQTEVTEAVRAYLNLNQLDHKIVMRFSPNYVSRTSMQKNILRLQLPLRYREHDIPGMLNHEIGTHFLRRYNEEQQLWHNKHEQFNFHSYLDTEEGLAVLHAKLPMPDKYIWWTALNYVVVYYGGRMTFAELFAYLKRYIADRDRRWNLCMKVKRGLTDTSIPGGYTKSQLYLRGTIKVAKWLINHDFAARRLYLGRIALEDVDIAQAVSQVREPRLPHFLQDHEAYTKHIRAVIRANNLPVE